MCELLVRKRARLDCVDKRGDTPLHRAILGYVNVVETLIAKMRR